MYVSVAKSITTSWRLLEVNQSFHLFYLRISKFQLNTPPPPPPFLPFAALFSKLTAQKFMGVGVSNHKQQIEFCLGKACKTKVRLIIRVPFREARGQKQEERVGEGGRG